MPDEPHEYTLRGETPEDGFEAFVKLIRGHGYEGTYHGRTYVYLNIGRLALLDDGRAGREDEPHQPREALAGPLA
jgi:hypothetical protein